MNSKTLSFVAASMFTLGASTAFAAGDRMPNGDSVYGKPAQEARSVRVVDVANTKSLNVKCGDIVTFASGGNRFTWKFDTVSHVTVPLAKIAPAGFAGANTKVYVSSNDLEQNG